MKLLREFKDLLLDHTHLLVSVVFVELLVLILLTAAVSVAPNNLAGLILLTISIAVIITTQWMLFEALRVIRALQNTRKARSQTKEAMETKTEFFQLASHQIRTPLTSLYSLIQLDAAGYFHELPPDKHKQFHEEMLKSATNLKSLVNSLLSMLRLEGEDLPLMFKPLNVLDVMKQAIDVVHSKYKEKGLTIAVNEPQSDVPLIEADREYLQQVFVNILDNAQRYTKEGGVTITAERVSHAVAVEVHDTGIGISKEDKVTVFKKFARGKNAKELQPEGSGLGLYIAQKIVVGHHGNLEINSDGEGKGTTVRITIPIGHKNVHYHLDEKDA